MKFKLIPWIPVLIISLLVACSGAQTESHNEETELYLLAAASLTDVVQEVKKVYEQEHRHVKLVPSFASSGKLQQQIEQGAPADLFISAGEKEMDVLIQEGQIVSDHHRSFLHNELVLIVSRNEEKIKGFEDLAQASKIAVGEPKTVPAGEYSKQTLQFMKLWDSLQSRMVFAGDVRQVLTYVETGNVDAGLVYRTDAQTSDRVTVAATAPAGSHRPIVYPMGVVKGSPNREEADRFYDWLDGKKARAIFHKYGFQDAAEK
ncbi:molybdate transport system substrate-binding protein [Kroppenstedtia sanguinis]|uniref:Molybdate ABC transporter substrate-binding protein n=1 Tax=Kroppenstedtia sanguinis TaxID=1380684 RepID=A0ABW4C5M9_9BACL